jgi:iron complex outermembrane receptor protein
MKAKNGLLFLSPYYFPRICSDNNKRSTLTGKIIDSATGQPLVGATVYFPDLKTGAASNNNGVYIIKNISQGTYLMEISSLGYLSVIEYVQVNGDVQKNFSLSRHL